MGKTAERMSELSVMLNGIEKSKVEIDKPNKEIKDIGTKRKKVKKEVWCAMEVPKEIYDICIYLKELLTEQALYVKSMDVQILNVAVQMWVYSNLITKMISGEEMIPVRAITTASESFRRALQSLGLTVTDKKSGIRKEDAEGNNPLEDMIMAMNSTENDDVVIKKKNKTE